jgi:hypothetical protein
LRRSSFRSVDFPHRILMLLAACLLLGSLPAGAIDFPDPIRPVILAQAAAGQPAAGADLSDGDLWALVIGINQYAGLAQDKQLKTAAPGAEAVGLVLRQYGVERERINILYDGRATLVRLQELFQGSLRRDVRAGDSLFLYFAGHCRVDPTTKEVWWLPADAAENTPASYLSNTDLLLFLDQVPAKHIFVVADSCLEDGWVGTSRISGDPAVRDLYQKKSRWLLSAGVPAPRDDGEERGPSLFTQTFVSVLRDNQLAYSTPLHIIQAMAERLPEEVMKTIRSGPLTGLGDSDGQFVFRLDGARSPENELRVPAQEDPGVARLRQHIETAKIVGLPQPIKDQVLAELQGKLGTAQKEVAERRLKQEAARQTLIEGRRRRQ